MKKKISYDEYKAMFPERAKKEKAIDGLIKDGLWKSWDCVWAPGATNDELEIILKMATNLKRYMDIVGKKSQEAFDEDEEGDTTIVIDVKE